MNVYDRSKSYIYNLTGAKIENTALCSIISNSKNFNIIFVLNNGNDTREYTFSLNNALQELSNFFPTQKKDLTFKYAAADCYPYFSSYSLKSELNANYSDVLSSMVNYTRKNMEDKSAKPTSSIVNGLANAAKVFRGKENENNIVVVISSQGDNAALELTNKALRELTINDLGRMNAKLFFMQPYCGKNPEYANFVQQAKLLIKSLSDKAAPIRKEKMVENVNSNSSANNFRSIINGPNNIYCLDYPENANNQGVLIFPTIGNKIEEKHFVNALDTLITQINNNNETIIASLNQVFNSTSSFNTVINADFQKYYSSQQTWPNDAANYFKNIDYQYFAPGYISYPQNTSFPPVKQTLLLSANEYDELYNVFKSIQWDQIGDNYDMKNRTASYQSMLKVLRRYSDERQTHIQEYTSFARYMYEVAGYEPENNLLKKYKVADLIATNTLLIKDMKALIAHINKRLALFYSIKDDKAQYFFSNGMKYYWVPEDYLP